MGQISSNRDKNGKLALDVTRMFYYIDMRETTVNPPYTRVLVNKALTLGKVSNFMLFGTINSQQLLTYSSKLYTLRGEANYTGVILS